MPGRLIPGLRAGAAGCGLVLACGLGRAHGDWQPVHGGWMNAGGETSFELVAARKSLRFYVSDHGEPVDTAGAAGAVSVSRRGAAVAAEAIVRAEGDTLVAPGIALCPGDELRVRVAWANGSVSVGRFTVPAGHRPAAPRTCR